MATGVACSSGPAPELDGLADQVAEVGTELQIDLDGTDTTGAALTYKYKTQVPDIAGNAEITVSPSGGGVFHWTPLAADVGSWYFDFTVSDGGAQTTVTIQIVVKSAIGASTAPIFREPLGTGTTLDTTTTQCLSVDVVIDDSDSATVAITQQEPLIDGATLTTIDGLTATWMWCPTAAQVAEQTHYTLVLSADDGDNPPTIKDYLIVLLGSSCPGAGPTITHTPANQTTILDLALSATIADPAGLKDMPLIYYSATAPATPPNLTAMTQLSMTETAGNMTSGTWSVNVPNPVASMPPGTTAKLYYVFSADDDGTSGGSAACVHTTISPVYSMTVTAGGSATVAACGVCSADAQCGAGNECVVIGTMGASYCLPACGTSCATGYTCSAAAVASIDGASEKVCEPNTGTCVAAPPTCIDDSYEDNDTRSEASHLPALPPGAYTDMISCPSTTGANTDDDWYKIVVSASARVDFLMMGGSATDLDLHLYHSDGTVVTASTSPESDEEINTCLPAATYYIKVNGFGDARNPYDLTYASAPETCNTTCVDDSNEDDDTFSQARDATDLPYSSSDQEICPNDDDWYHVILFTGDDLTVDLTFTQTSEANDLDLHLYQNDVDLTPCSPADPSTCTAANGQGSVSNEHTSFTAPTGCDDGCDYDVVVRGWNGASNEYSIAIDVQ